MSHGASFWRSLRFRLPLLFSILIVAVLALFLWTTNRALEEILIRSAGDRAQATADQIAALWLQGVTRGLAEVRRVAGDPRIQAALTAPNPEAVDNAKRVLLMLSGPGQPPVELWNASGERVAAVARSAAEGIAPSDQPPTSAGLTPFRTENNVVVYEVVSEVDEQARTDDASVRRLGFVVVRRTLTSAQTSDSLNRVLGSGVAAIGNQRGDVWSDFKKAVAGPTVTTVQRGAVNCQRPDGEPCIGAMSLIAGTPWAAWIEFPQSIVLNPARLFLRRMLLLAALFIAFASLAAWIISARITRPLDALTQASEAIAAGRFDERVPQSRPDEMGRLGAAFNTMTERVATAQLQLESQVRERTSELERTVRELETFSYSVSHDLRAPLRAMDGFSKALLDEYAPALDEQGQHYLQRVRAATRRMSQLIDDLLSLSRITRAPLTRSDVNMTDTVQEILGDLKRREPERRLEARVPDGLGVKADPQLLRIALENLLGNAWKFTSKEPIAQIEVGHDGRDAERVFFVRDNGAGFDMQYAGKLFAPFQRLHSDAQFEGTGVGLATVHRIVGRHGGRIWAESRPGGGATFFFTLGAQS